MNAPDISGLTLPLAFLLAALVIWRLWADLRPFFLGFVSAMSDHAKRHATGYALGFVIALAASLQELTRVAAELQWVHIGAAARVLQPGLVAILAFIRPAPSPRTTDTNSPIAK